MGKRNSPAPSFALGVTPSFFWVAVKKIEHDNDNENEHDLSRRLPLTLTLTLAYAPITLSTWSTSASVL
jgi:hypothetical protein